MKSFFRILPGDKVLPNFPLFLALFTMGFTFTITQVMVIRELLVVFTGNELSIAIILANWLILEAAGSFFIGKKVASWRFKEGGYAFFQLLISILLPLTIYGIRSLRDLMGLSPGEGASLGQILFWTVPVLAPIGIGDGILFALGCTLYSKRAEKGAISIGKVYLFEALGAGTGGMLYTFLFIPFFLSFQVAFLLGAVNLFSGLLLLRQAVKEQRKKGDLSLLWSLFLLINLWLLTPMGSQQIERHSLDRLWRGLTVLESRWSPYGNVTVGRSAEQITFFANGIPILNAPVPNVAFVEELVHYPLLLLPAPEKVLIVGGGFGGVVHEILRHPVQEIHYAEIDPLLVQLVRENLTPLTRREIENPKVRVHTVDGRFFIKTTPQKFNVIILNLPAPFTLELNRFYTIDFFREVWRVLREDGLLVLSLPGSETYLAPEVRDLNLTLLLSLQEVFPSVLVIPGDPNFLLVSPSQDLGPLTLERMLSGLREKKVQPQFLTDFHLRQKLEKQRLEWFKNSLRHGGEVRLNRDAAPSGLYYGIAYWNAQFHPSIQLFWNWLGNLRFWHLALPLGLLVGIVFIREQIRRGRRNRGLLVCTVVTTGFFGTAMSILLLFSFQTLYGHAYQWIGLLVASFMAGLALGSLMMTRFLERDRPFCTILLRVEVMIIAFILLAVFLLSLFYSSGAESGRLWLVKLGFLILSLISGFWVGLEFPLSSQIFAAGVREVGWPAGVLYASDLIGAWMGSLLVGVILVPVLGVFQTGAVILLLKIANWALLIITGWSKRI